MRNVPLALLAAVAAFSAPLAATRADMLRAPAALTGAAHKVIAAATQGGAALTAQAGAIQPAVNTGPEWRIYKTEWSETDEAGYAAFVTAIGESGCKTLGACLKSAANPYRHTDKRTYYGDCADMAYMLRAYYAWKNGLPFSFQSAMRTADGEREDVRYSGAGNLIADRRDVTTPVGGAPVNAPRFIAEIGGLVSTAMFRTDPAKGGGRWFDDFYAVKINRAAVTPGVVAYDIYGHVGIVYDVGADGRVRVVASHPDHTITRSLYGPNFLRAKPELGSGLKAWRPIRLVGAEKGPNGDYVGGRIVAADNHEIDDYSLEQYFGTEPHPSGDWALGQFRHDGRTLSYYDYVRRRLAAADFAYDPVDELREGMRELCSHIKQRNVAVDLAVEAGVPQKPHPARLPVNIYGTTGEWEAYSTPSRDARLKVSFIELRRTMQELVAKLREGDPGVRYAGSDLAGDLLEVYDEEASACTFVYSRSDGSKVRLNYDRVARRLFDLSFDPYHCAERRWGATGAELQTCTDGPDKDAWYAAQRFLRYQAERTYDVRMNFARDELKPPMLASPEAGGLGVDAPADVDLRGYLQSLRTVDSLARDEWGGYSGDAGGAM